MIALKQTFANMGRHSDKEQSCTKCPFALSLSSFLADLLPSLLLLIPLHLLIFSDPIFYSLCHLNLCRALSMLPILYSLPQSLQRYEFAFKHCANSLAHNDTTAPQI